MLVWTCLPSEDSRRSYQLDIPVASDLDIAVSNCTLQVARYMFDSLLIHTIHNSYFVECALDTADELGRLEHTLQRIKITTSEKAEWKPAAHSHTKYLTKCHPS